MDELDDAELLRAFEDCTIPFDRWDHRSHLRVAWILLWSHPFDIALEKIRSGIQRYNAATQVEEGRTMGYHETLTVAWARLIRDAIVRHHADGAIDSRRFYAACPDITDRTRLRAHYSSEHITSWEAKRAFVEPDLAPLPLPSEPDRAAGELVHATAPRASAT